jgi:CheY-like chemotaxis protein
MKVLIVDGDMRNIFALTSALERDQMHILHAERGPEAIALLNVTRDVEAVLMDIMMPEMDGFEVIRRIRTDARFARLPVIAVMAKAMKADRDQCVEAGASDYRLRVWLARTS